VLEGSVRKSGDKIRITGQLIDAITGAHLWAEHFDGSLQDIFDLQDQLTASVVTAVSPKLQQAEIDRVTNKPTENLDAYDCYLRGMAALHRWTKETNEEALSYFYRAIELDAKFAPAYGMAARCYSRRKTAGWVIDRDFEIVETLKLAQAAGELGRDDAVALCSAGTALAFVVGDLDRGATYIERSLALDPNLAYAWFLSGWINVWRGEHEVAIGHLARAMRFSPHDPLTWNMQAGTAAAHYFAGRLVEALSWAERSFQEQPDSVHSTSVVAASAALLGKPAPAAKAMSRLRRLMPELRLSNLKDLYPIRQPEDFDRWAQGMRAAGLPD
jgi:tetratricopeptide (TPR) repeat protein